MPFSASQHYQKIIEEKIGSENLSLLTEILKLDWGLSNEKH